MQETRITRSIATTLGSQWPVALAGLAAATCPLTSNAGIVSSVGLEKQVLLGETYTLPGVAGINFAHNASWLKTTSMGGTGRIGSQYPYFVAAGLVVGPSDNSPIMGGMTWATGSNIPPLSFGTYSGALSDEGYLPFLFESADGTHYGWVDLTVTPTLDQMTIHGYGYETISGESIVTGQAQSQVPEPGSLALAAAGVLAGLGAARRSRRKLVS